MAAVVVFASAKGGVAKTTTLVCVAVCAWQAGHRVVIIDVDAQASAVKWGRRRDGLPTVIACTPDSAAAAVEELAGEFDLIFIDTPGANTPDVHRVLALGDLTIIPVSTSWIDLEDSLPTARVLKAHGRLFFYLLARCPPNERRISEAQKLLDRHEGRAGVIVSWRVAYHDALASGLGVTELRRSREAAQEITALWEWVAQKLGMAKEIGDGEA